MEYTIVQLSDYEFNVYQNINSTYSIYIGKTSTLKIADKMCYDYMNDIKQYGRINKILIND